MKKDKTLIGIVVLIVILLIASFFMSGDKDKNDKDDKGYEKEHNKDDNNHDDDYSEEDGDETPTSTDEDVLSNLADVDVVGVLAPSTETKPSLTYTWKPQSQAKPTSNNVSSDTSVEAEPQFSGLEYARVQYTHDSKILIDVRDDADTPRLRYSIVNADPIAILSKMYGLSTKQVMDLTTITYKELDRDDAKLIGDIVAADSYVSSGNTLIAVQGESAKYFFWNDDSNVYTSAKEAGRYMRKNVSQFWDKFFSN